MSADADVTRAANRLIAAAVAHRESLRSGQGPSRQEEFTAAVDGYLAVRTDLDRARDDHLIRRSRAATPRTGAVCICTIEQVPGRFPRIVDRDPNCPVHRLPVLPATGLGVPKGTPKGGFGPQRGAQRAGGAFQTRCPPARPTLDPDTGDDQAGLDTTG